MTDNYRKELVQVAAVCLAAAQVAECDTTSLGTDNEGVRGRFSLEKLLDEVRAERRAQELKWGTRHNEDATMEFWLDVMMEEVGEVAQEVQTLKGSSTMADAMVKLGERARAKLEVR